MLRVLDDGLGIDKDLLPRVFDLFTQADRSVARSQGGLGIGLTLVRSLVESHGGSVQAIAKDRGRGASLWFACRWRRKSPRTATRAEQAGEGSRALSRAAMVHHRVLVVDDNADAARTFAEIAPCGSTRSAWPTRRRPPGIGRELSSRRGAFGHRPAWHERLPGGQAIAAAAGVCHGAAGGGYRLRAG